MTDLNGRRALVTGGGRGIGLAISRRLAVGGAQVAVADLDPDVVQEAIGDLGDGALALRCDVRSTDEVQAAVDATVEAFGGLDLLVNNAGVELVASVVDTDEDAFARLLDVNVLGVFRCTRAAVTALSQDGGAIVNVASIAGIGGAPLQSAYCASKGALLRFTESAALELRPQGIRVNAVCPALVDTAMASELAGPLEAVAGIAFDELVGMKQGRLAQPEEIAETVAFLASGEADGITGARYVIDNGLSASLL